MAYRCSDERAASSDWLRKPSLFLSSWRKVEAELAELLSDDIDDDPLERVEPLTPGTLPAEPDEPLVPVEPEEPVVLRVDPVPMLPELELRDAPDDVNSLSEMRPSLSASRVVKFAALLPLRSAPWLEPKELLEPVPLDERVPLVVLPVEDEGDWSMVEPELRRSEPDWLDWEPVEPEPCEPDEPEPDDCASAGTVTVRRPAARRLVSLRWFIIC